jgi:hypothetical protein
MAKASTKTPLVSLMAIKRFLERLRHEIVILLPVLWIWIPKIRTFVSLQDLDPYVRGTDPDPSIIKQKQC